MNDPLQDPIEREPPQWRVLVIVVAAVILIFFVAIPWLLLHWRG